MRSHPMIASSWSNTWWTLSRYHKLQCAYCQQISRSISKMVLWAFLAIWWLTGPGKSSLAQTLTNNNGLMTCFHMNWWTMMTYELLMINLTFPGPPVFPAKWLSSWLPRFRKTAETIEKDPWNLQRAADALREWVEALLFLMGPQNLFLAFKNIMLGPPFVFERISSHLSLSSHFYCWFLMH